MAEVLFFIPPPRGPVVDQGFDAEIHALPCDRDCQWCFVFEATQSVRPRHMHYFVRLCDPCVAYLRARELKQRLEGAASHGASATHPDSA